MCMHACMHSKNAPASTVLATIGTYSPMQVFVTPHQMALLTIDTYNPMRTLSMPRCPEVALFFWVLAICQCRTVS